MQPIDVPAGSEAAGILEQHVTGPLYRPQGPAGQIGQTFGGVLGNPLFYLSPAGAGARAAGAFTGALGSEAAGQLTKGTWAEPYARFVGALLGGAAGEPVANAMRGGFRPASRPQEIPIEPVAPRLPLPPVEPIGGGGGGKHAPTAPIARALPPPPVEPPTMLSLPAPPMMLALPPPAPRLALPAPSAVPPLSAGDARTVASWLDPASGTGGATLPLVAKSRPPSLRLPDQAPPDMLALPAPPNYPRLTGPPPDRQQSWKGMITSELVPSSGRTVYRVWDPPIKENGFWLTPDPPVSSAAALRDLALSPDNTAKYISPVWLPVGERIQTGIANGIFGQPGGGRQIQLLRKLPDDNFGPRRTLPPK